MRERVVVTGAAGFIGGHTCRALLEAGYEVVGFDNFDPFYPRSLKEGAVKELSSRRGFSFVEADIRDPRVLEPALAGADAAVHLAARPGVRPSLENPAPYLSVNVEGTARVLEACVRAGVRRVVFGSSSSVYGNATPVPFREDAPEVEPISPYAATKRAGERLCDVYRHLHRLRVAVLRFFTVYGPRQRPDLAIHQFTRKLAAGRPVQCFGDGSSERDYTHIDDIVRGVLGGVRWTEGGGPACEVFNLGESVRVRLDYLIDLIARALGVTPAISSLPPQPGDVRRTCADISKARSVLGYRPEVSLEIGIPAFVDWFRTAYGSQTFTTA